MSRFRSSRKKPPSGWNLIEPELEELHKRMRDAEKEPHEGKRKAQSCWKIFRLHHERSRFVFTKYRTKEISRELYEYCLREGYADGNLIAKWKKQGYEKLCCLQCIQSKGTSNQATCICRVPKKNIEDGKAQNIECELCGCRGCASGDA